MLTSVCYFRSGDFSQDTPSQGWTEKWKKIIPKNIKYKNSTGDVETIEMLTEVLYARYVFRKNIGPDTITMSMDSLKGRNIAHVPLTNGSAGISMPNLKMERFHQHIVDESFSALSCCRLPPMTSPILY